MGVASVQALMCSMVALSAAALHGFTCALRRKEPAHLWLATSALGIVGIAISTVLVYEAGDVVGAEFGQRLMLAAAAPTLIGFHNFTLSLLELRRTRLDRVCEVVVSAIVLQVFWPDLVFGGAPFERVRAIVSDLLSMARRSVMGDARLFGQVVVKTSCPGSSTRSSPPNRRTRARVWALR